MSLAPPSATTYLDPTRAAHTRPTSPDIIALACQATLITA